MTIMMGIALLLAQQAAPVCPVDAPSPAGWRGTRSVAAGVTTRTAPPLVIGAGTTVKLSPVARVDFAPRPEKTPDAASHGGLLALTVTRAGRYRIALGGPAWVDLIQDGKAVASAAHGHGAACSGVRKQVDFDLTPGGYVIHLSGSAAPDLRIMASGPA